MTLANWLAGVTVGLPLALFLVIRVLRGQTSKETN